MSNAVLVHGWAGKAEFDNPDKPTPSNSHWFPWLTKQLMMRGIPAQAIEVPNSYYPEYDGWKTELERYDIDESTILVGHSLGAGFLMRWLSENKNKKVGKVILVAPWVGLKPQQPMEESFFVFEWDKALTKRTKGVVIMSSKDDAPEIQQSVEVIQKHIDGTQLIEFEDKGHFTQKSLKTVEFPELLTECLK